MKLSVAYKDGIYSVYVNEMLAAAFNEESTFDYSESTLKGSLGEGNRKIGLFAERKVTFVNWSYSTVEEGK